MNKFYTSCVQSGNQILIREIVDGVRINRKENYQPELYIKSNKPKSKYKTLHGEPLEAIQFESIKESREWIKGYEDTPNFPIYGNTFFHFSWLAENYPGEIEYNFKQLSVWSLDIEVEAEKGFPQVDTASERINLITFKNIQTQEIWSFGLPFHGKKQPYKTDRKNVYYEPYSNEEDMCAAFLNKWAEVQPDIILGYNSEFFDVPYLITRMHNLFGHDVVRKALSPWSYVHEKSIDFYGQEKKSFDIGGVAILDYYRLYRKYISEPRENYKLGFIAETDLNIGKLDHEEYATFSEFYKKNWQKYVDYNIRDVELVEALDKKWKLVELLLMVAYKSKVNYEDVLSQTKVWDMLIFNHLRKQNIIIPAKVHHSKAKQYDGAYVKEPIPGLYKWVVSLDFQSLYPSIMMILNQGPETKVLLNTGGTAFPITPTNMLQGIVNFKKPGQMSYLEASKGQNVTLASNGICYTKEKKSVYNELLTQLFNLRLEYKAKEKDSKKEIESIKVEIERRKITKICG